MANKIILKRSSVASKVPLATDLETGELAVNLIDQKLYSKKADGTVVLVGSGLGGSGDVQGAASSTDNAIVRFDGTNGKVIQNSAATIADNGDISTSRIILTSTGAEGGEIQIKNSSGSTVSLVDVDAAGDLRLISAGVSLWLGTNENTSGRLIGTEWRSGAPYWQFTDSGGVNMMTLYNDANGPRAEVTYLAVGTRRPATRGAIDINSSKSLSYGPYYYVAGVGFGGTASVTGAPVGIYCDSRIVANELNAVSDIRVKENIVDIDTAAALRFVVTAKTVRFNFKQDQNRPTNTTYGWIAQDILKTDFPELINAGPNESLKEYDDGTVKVPAGIELHANYMGGVAVLQAAIKEQQKMIDELRAEISAIKG